MLEIKDDGYYNRVVEFAEKKGLKKFLDERVDYLRKYGDQEQTGRFKVVLRKDWAPASFSVVWYLKNAGGEYEFFCNGGLIYHGDQQGWDDSGQQVDPLSVRLASDANPWDIHT